MANPDLRNFGEINVGEILTLKSASNYNYVENWNLCVVMWMKPYFVSNKFFLKALILLGDFTLVGLSLAI